VAAPGARFASPRGRGIIALALTTCLVSVPDVASGAQAARLVYSRNAGASACPDEGALRQAVLRRLGYDPFVAYALRTMVVELRGDGSGLMGRVYMVDGDNAAGGTRELASPKLDCKELISAVALAISIAIDPDAIDRLSAEPSPTTDDANVAKGPAAENASLVQPAAQSPKRDSKAVVGPAAEPSPTEPPLGPTWSAGVGPAIASGPAPAPQFELALLLGVRGEHWAMTLEPRMSFPSSTDPGQLGTAHMSLYGATLSPCYRYGPLLGCYVFEGALAVSTGDGPQARTDHSFWWAQGLRAGVRWDAGRGLGISARLDGLWAPEQIALRADGHDIFETPRILVRFGVFVDYEF